MELGLPAAHEHLALGAALRAGTEQESRRELKPTNGSWRVDETYICQGGSWRYLYRAVDSSGATIDFWFSAERGGGSQAVLPESLTGSWSSPAAGHHRRRQPVMPLSNLPVFVVEQDHRGVKRRVNASQGFRSFDGGWRTIQRLRDSAYVRTTPGKVAIFCFRT